MTNNLLLNSQNKSDLDETFTEPSDGYCFKPNQLLIFSKPAKKKSDLDETPTEPSDGHCLKPDQTNSKSSLKQPKQVGLWWNFHRSFRWMLSQTEPNQTDQIKH